MELSGAGFCSGPLDNVGADSGRPTSLRERTFTRGSQALVASFMKR